MGVLFQVYAFLRIYQNVFTHYDLHIENVLLISIPNHTLYFSYTDTNSKQKIAFISKYLVKIIDYGSYYCQKITESFVLYSVNKQRIAKITVKMTGIIHYQMMRNLMLRNT